MTFSRLLSEADLALSTAFLIGPNTWNVRAVMKDTEKTPLGRKQWKELLERALKNRHIRLYAQSVVRAGNQDAILHLEILSRIDLDDGKVLSANAFIPIAERLKLVSSLDRMVVEEVIKLDRSRLGADTIAVNLSASSFQDELFVGWLHKTIKNLPVSVPRIIFEFAEFGAVQNEQLLKSFAVVVHECGHKVGLDHYGQSGGHLKYLRSLQPDYVKIDQAYTAELKDEDSDSRFFISSICSVAHSIDVVVIAEGVETENQRHILQRLNIDAVQGYLIDRPKPLQGI